jgi:hypothetical protein
MTALFPIMARWCSLFGGRRLGFAASLMLFPVLVLTTSYHTFYDVGIVLFYTVGLYCLAVGRTRWYLVAIGAATLNHENILLLIVLSGMLARPWRPTAVYDWRFVAVQVALHAAIRGSLFYLLPETRVAAMGNVWINLHLLSTGLQGSRSLVETAVLVVWFGTALAALPFAPPFLRKAAIVLPMLVAVTLLVGQMNEARQFLAFVPVAIALVVCMIPRAAGDADPRPA